MINLLRSWLLRLTAPSAPANRYLPSLTQSSRIREEFSRRDAERVSELLYNARQPLKIVDVDKFYRQMKAAPGRPQAIVRQHI
jgi:hypothetical protein